MKKQTSFELVFLAVILLVFITFMTWIAHKLIEGPQLGTIYHLTNHIRPSDIYPSNLTPGVTNPDITQANINQTICNPHWSTKSIRPSVSYTNKLKIQQIKQYEYADTNLADFEEDHLISLELGGSPTDPRNLWPEPYKTSVQDGGARTKDKVENYLHREVCSGNITLQDAQHQIATDWYAVYKQMSSQ